MKKAALSGEVLYNCSLDIREKEGEEILRKCCHKLLRSGYNQYERDVQKQADISEVKIRVVEKGGKDVRSLLQRSDVQPPRKCHKGQLCGLQK